MYQVFSTQHPNRLTHICCLITDMFGFVLAPFAAEHCVLHNTCVAAAQRAYPSKPLRKPPPASFTVHNNTHANPKPPDKQMWLTMHGVSKRHNKWPRLRLALKWMTDGRRGDAGGISYRFHSRGYLQRPQRAVCFSVMASDSWTLILLHPPNKKERGCNCLWNEWLHLGMSWRCQRYHESRARQETFNIWSLQTLPMTPPKQNL